MSGAVELLMKEMSKPRREGDLPLKDTPISTKLDLEDCQIFP